MATRYDASISTPQDEDERDPEDGEPIPQCFNQLDDDGDGIIDYPFEPGCIGKGDDDEADPRVLAACANGRDDDDRTWRSRPTDPTS